MRAYLDAAPVRRRLRLALLIIVAGTLLWLWPPAIAKAWSAAHYPTATQAGIDAEPCRYGMDAVANGQADCPHDTAADRNAAIAYGAGENTRKALLHPLGPTFAMLVAAAALWSIIPLLDRRTS